MFRSRRFWIAFVGLFTLAGVYLTARPEPAPRPANSLGYESPYNLRGSARAAYIWRSIGDASRRATGSRVPGELAVVGVLMLLVSAAANAFYEEHRETDEDARFFREAEERERAKRDRRD